MTSLKTKQSRTIPIGASLQGEGAVLPYDEARRLIEAQSKILVAPCICRKEHTLVGKGCGKSVETCLVFSGGAHYYEWKIRTPTMPTSNDSYEHPFLFSRKAESSG
jgi:hypothetical protein